MKFRINFDYNLEQPAKRAEVKFEVTRYVAILTNYDNIVIINTF